MKMYLSAFSLLILSSLVGCGGEQFGTVPQSSKDVASGVETYTASMCSSFTLTKPKVDILYVVDNSTSNYYLGDDIKTAVTNTVNSISGQFDYRVVGTTLIPDSTPYDDYQIMTNSTDALTSAASGRKVISPSELNFFNNRVTGTQEPGLRRVVEFMTANPDSVLRDGAYHIVVIVSNGRDTEVEIAETNGDTSLAKDSNNVTIFSKRLASLKNVKTNILHSQQLRLFSVVPKTNNCQEGWKHAPKSYTEMSKQLYIYSGATDNNSAQDSYDLCSSGSLTSIFTPVNNSIQENLQPHVYKYWPITFSGTNVDFSQLQVFKIVGGSGSATPVLMPSSTYTYKNSSVALNTRILPTVGEPQPGPHFVEFNSNSYITYPDCVQVKAVSKTEYFGYSVLPKEPKPSTILVRINGSTIPQSATNGWTYIGNSTRNVKMPYPAAGDELPAVTKSGFMIQLNGTSNYFKSGDTIEVDYIPAGI